MSKKPESSKQEKNKPELELSEDEGSTTEESSAEEEEKKDVEEQKKNGQNDKSLQKQKEVKEHITKEPSKEPLKDVKESKELKDSDEPKESKQSTEPTKETKESTKEQKKTEKKETKKTKAEDKTKKNYIDEESTEEEYDEPATKEKNKRKRSDSNNQRKKKKSEKKDSNEENNDDNEKNTKNGKQTTVLEPVGRVFKDTLEHLKTKNLVADDLGCKLDRNKNKIIFYYKYKTEGGKRLVYKDDYVKTNIPTNNFIDSYIKRIKDSNVTDDDKSIAIKLMDYLRKDVPKSGDSVKAVNYSQYSNTNKKKGLKKQIGELDNISLVTQRSEQAALYAQNRLKESLKNSDDQIDALQHYLDFYTGHYTGRFPK